MSDGPSRRRIIKNIGAGTAGVGVLSQPASARRGIGTRGGDKERAWSIPRRERRRRMRLIPVKGAQKRWFGRLPTYDETGMYAYCGSINIEDLCYWRASGCLYAAAAGTLYQLKLGRVGTARKNAIAGAVFCVLGSAACQAIDNVEKAGLVADSDWLHVYGLAGPWWFRTFDNTFPDWYVVVTVRD